MANSRTTDDSNHAEVISLDPGDNVVVAIEPLAAGQSFVVHDARVLASVAIQAGHKIATRAIAQGDLVVKYGQPIGIATADIAPGDHVHIHNVDD